MILYVLIAQCNFNALCLIGRVWTYSKYIPIYDIVSYDDTSMAFDNNRIIYKESHSGCLLPVLLQTQLFPNAIETGRNVHARRLVHSSQMALRTAWVGSVGRRCLQMFRLTSSKLQIKRGSVRALNSARSKT